MKPPSTAWPITPSGSSAPSHIRSRRYGRRRSANSHANPAAITTGTVTTRLENSITACVFSGGYTLP